MFESNTHKPNVLAVDIGYGNTKVVADHGLDRTGLMRWTEICFPSIAVAVVVDEEDAGFNNPDRVMIEYKGQRYYAGPKATSGVVPRIIEPNYIETDLHEVLLRAAIHFAMRESGKLIRRIDMLVLGLPVSGFQTGRDRLRQIALSGPREIPVPKNLQGVSSGMRSVTVEIADCRVIPQPYGATNLASFSLPATDAAFMPGALTMVVDPGYRTMDWFVSESMLPELKLSGSYDGGVSGILREISQKIGFDHGTGSLEFDTVERGLRLGQINMGNKVIDMTPYAQMVPALANQEIGTFITRLGNRRNSLTRVYLAGGGARYYEAALRERLSGFDVQMLDASVMSNARGYWLFGRETLDD